jgi:glycosyltransferase involved in cell wall biosynthesis
MIVKNEERFLADCLKSIKRCVDEIIIVDTGSTDRTVQIAKSFGAEVYHHPWENDFSKHRNQSINYARGDWILWIDADEALEPDSGKVIRDAVKTNGIDSLMVTMVCYFSKRTRESWNNAIKLFRKGLGIHFEGRVHNQVVGCRQTGFCPVKIFHYGYDVDHLDIKRKFERTSTLLKKAIQEDPDNFRHHHDLAVSYSSVRLFRKAIEEGIIAIELYKKNGCSDSNILWTYFVVASSSFNINMIKHAERFAQEAITIDPEHFDSYFILAAVYAARKDWKRFREVYSKIDHLLKKYEEILKFWEGSSSIRSVKNGG